MDTPRPGDEDTTTRTIVRDVRYIPMDDVHGVAVQRGDITVIDDRIVAVGERQAVTSADRVIDGSRLVAIPGLVNSHIHSWEAFFRGRYDNLPLELWMLYSYPALGAQALPAELIRLRTLLVAVESLRNGVTCLLDDVIEMPGQSMEALDAVMRGYEEAGIRANCSGNVVDRRFLETIPYAEALLPAADIDALNGSPPPPTVEEYIDFSTEAFRRYDGRSGRLRYVVAPSGPQRCTDALLIAAAELSERWSSAYHMHVLETKMQAVTGREKYGSTLVEYLAELGVLSPRMSIAHGVWLTDGDVERLAEAGASVAHNPISNLKLGSGIAPFRLLRRAGVNVGLGTDGASSNDTARMFDVMKVGALIHKSTGPDFHQWPTASEMFTAATRGGARCVQMDNSIGQIATGFKADLVLLREASINFTPENNLVNQLVYCENGTSIDTVIVNGEVVVSGGRVTTIDEEALIDEIREVAPAVLRQYEQVERANDRFAETFEAIYRKCAEEDIGLERWATQAGGWFAG